MQPQSPPRGGWPTLVLIWFYGVTSAASLSKAIPLQDHIAALAGAGPGSYALFLALMAVPPALLGTLSGAFIDRIGARPALIGVALLGVAVNLLYLAAGSIGQFLPLRVLEGCVPLVAYAAAPALMIAASPPERRGAAMSLWSTYTPVGTSLGLALAAVFAGTEHWRWAYALHAAVFAALAVAGTRLPRITLPPGPRPSPLALLHSREGLPPLLLALTFGVLIFLGLGLSVVFPAYLARVHHMSLGAASGILAGANLVMIAGSTLTGICLTRGVRPTTLLLILALAGCLTGAGAFAPWPALAPTLLALLLWQVCTGGAMAVAASQLPRVVTPAHRAAAAGLISQTGAILTFVTPSAWVPAASSGHWLVPALICVSGWVLAYLLLPRPAPPPPTAQTA